MIPLNTSQDLGYSASFSVQTDLIHIIQKRLPFIFVFSPNRPNFQFGMSKLLLAAYEPGPGIFLFDDLLVSSLEQASLLAPNEEPFFRFPEFLLVKEEGSS